MNRRHLFNLLVGAAFVPKELIEPAKTYFLPPHGGWASFSIIDQMMRRIRDAEMEMTRVALDALYVPTRDWAKGGDELMRMSGWNFDPGTPPMNFRGYHVLGVPIHIDPTLKPGEWYFRQETIG